MWNWLVAIGFSRGVWGVVIPLIFPKVSQSSQTESSKFPTNTPETLGHPGTLANPVMVVWLVELVS